MPGSSRGNWPKVAIGALVLINLVLFALLGLRQPTEVVRAKPATSPADTTRSPRSSPTPPGTAGDSTPTESASNAGRSTRMLAVASDTLAWRAVFGPCPGGSDLEVSRDGGRTWRAAKSGLKAVSRLRAYGDSGVFAVGGATDCESRYVATDGPGKSWTTYDRLLGETWYRVPKGPNRVHAPGGRISQPCGEKLRDFAGLGDLGAAALCADGTVRTTQDSGQSWRDLRGVSTALSLGTDGQVYAVAMRREGCDGVALAVLDPGAEEIDRDRVRCAPAEGSESDEVAVGVREQVVWLWLGDEVKVSTNRGRTWDRSS
ncbi:MAG TPA: hypothetical protein VE617_15820 [Propionibacteriaceae bacterium]|nr:hypothetical protein [Propionibacteriaceae bacterium]